MRVIALEEHMFPRDVLDDAHLDLGARASRRLDELDDLGEGRLSTMDAAGVDVSVLSGVSHIVQELAPDYAPELAATLNDRMAKAITRHPDRFRAFATLPMSAPTAAVDELRRAVEELGFLGAMIHGQTNGVFLDDPSVHPVLACAEALGVPIYLHPGPPPPLVRTAYFS